MKTRKQYFMAAAILLPLLGNAAEEKLSFFHAGQPAEAEKVINNFLVIEGMAASTSKAVEALEATVNAIDQRLTAVEERIGGTRDISGRCYHGTSQISVLEVTDPAEHPRYEETRVGTGRRAILFYADGSGELGEVTAVVSNRFKRKDDEVPGPIYGAGYKTSITGFSWAQERPSEVNLSLNTGGELTFYVSNGADVLLGTKALTTFTPYEGTESAPDKGDHYLAKASQSVHIAEGCDLVSSMLEDMKQYRAN